MILYSLVCERGHAFEAWFKDSVAFDRQTAAGKVACPQCGAAKVEKAPMAPRIAKKSAAERAAPLAHASGKDAKLGRLLKALREHVEQNYDYVGERFAEEARRIHHGEAEERDIYGKATADDARALKEEGIPVAPLPPLPRRND
jgi:hypothetical protein